jgi:hypothetical protein
MSALVVVIVAFSGPLGACLLAYLTGRQRLSEKREDWRRQDEVAARLLAANDEVAEQLLTANGKTDVKLDEIHVLVNSNLTAAMQSELNSLQGQLALMNKVSALTGETSVDPTVEVIESRISELSKQMENRHETEQELTPAPEER